VPDDSDEPVDHPAIAELFDLSNGRYELRPEQRN
jgi:heat shock protein HspQ